MTIKLEKSAYYNIRAPQNFYSAMRRDVQLLLSHPAYTTCTTVVLCSIDALSAGNGDTNEKKFKRFVSEHFPVLCTELEQHVPKTPGAKILYERFRHGFAHLRGPKSGFAIGDNEELKGRYASRVEIDGVGTFVAINSERLIKDFLELLDRIEKDAA